MRSELPRALAALVLLSMIACAGGDVGPESGETTPGSPSARARAVPGAPSATMQAGTASVDGALVRFCRSDDCSAPEASPTGSVWLADDELLLFALSEVPRSARVAIKAQGATDPLAARALRPGDLMATHAALPAGRYLVTLVASWPQREATWRFRLRVPADL